MIIIINGSVGAGKTSVAWALQKKCEKSIMLDGDYIGAIQLHRPSFCFEIPLFSSGGDKEYSLFQS